MAFTPGATNNDDGAIASTGSSQKSGIFARNDDTNPAPVGTPGGNGVFGLSTVPNASGVFGANNNGGIGVAGISGQGDGIQGTTESSTKSGVFGRNNSTSAAKAPGGSGVFGLTVAPSAAGVFGANNNPTLGRGVQGNGPEAGVGGFSESGFGVIGQSKKSSGVVGTSEHGQGLTAHSENDVGIFGRGATFAGVFEGALVVSKGPNPKDPNKLPSDINGSIVINDGNLFVKKGDVILTGADCAEEFNVAETENIEPGTVMVISDLGTLRVCNQSYDKKVAGVISGAGEYKPGIVLDRQTTDRNRQPIALLGKVYCKVDAQFGAIEVGDLLTTSSTYGHAMKVVHSEKSPGSILGKALQSLKEGQGMIPILVALQ